MTAWLTALMLAVQAPASVAGVYQTRQMEAAATLELRQDGTFLYMLDYGAVSEAAEGHWSAAKGAIHLDSDPLAMDVMRRIERSDAAFNDEQLAVDEDVLVMRRHDTLFKFYRAGE
jgi:hypothetical protein